MQSRTERLALRGRLPWGEASVLLGKGSAARSRAPAAACEALGLIPGSRQGLAHPHPALGSAACGGPRRQRTGGIARASVRGGGSGEPRGTSAAPAGGLGPGPAGTKG